MTREQLDRLKKSIEKYGFLVPIITNKDLVIADGEQRWIIANELAMPQVLVVRVPLEEVDRLLIQQIMNSPAVRGVHDLLLDAMSFENIIDLGKKDDLKYLLDLTDKDLSSYLNQLNSTEEDDFETPNIEKVVTDIKRGDVLELGRHRLMCGDASNKEDSFKLIGSNKIGAIYTDPPYGMGLKTDWTSAKSNLKFTQDKGAFGGHKYESVINDNLAFTATPFIESFPDIEQFWWGADYYVETIPNKQGSWIVWDKRVEENLDKGFGSSFELCWSKNQHKRDIARIKWFGIFGMEKEDTKKRVHPTQKPASLCKWFLDRFVESKDAILDLFGGSGSTLIACEQTNRTCYMMEIDPRYCEIICQRWEKYTGQKRVKLVNSGKNNV
jgi:site-specific DNA-methyltransferase (adenine-specific)